MKKRNHVCNLLNPNVMKLHNLYVDTSLERFHLNNKNVYNDINIPGSTLMTSPIINVRNTFF